MGFDPASPPTPAAAAPESDTASTPSWAAALERGAPDEPWMGPEDFLADDPSLPTPEFPPGVDLPPDRLGRRQLLGFFGASAALAGLTGCMQNPREKIVPYNRAPPEVTPGVSVHYATSLSPTGYAVGVIVAAREGRPVKIEGNPEHPASLGAAGPYEQASLLQLYDPQRRGSIQREGTLRSFRDLVAAWAPAAQAPLGRGEGVHFLLEPTGSVVVSALLASLRQQLPEARIHFWSPLAPRTEWEGLRRVAGRPLEARARLENAEVVLSLDSDFLGPTSPEFLRHSREFARGRQAGEPGRGMSRLYVVESALTVTGMNADHRLPRRASDIGRVAAQLAAELASDPATRPAGLSAEALSALERWRAPEGERRWLQAVAKDLAARRGASLVLAGRRQPPEVHALAHLLNAALGNVGRTVRYTESALLEAGTPAHDLAALARELRGDAKAVVILGGNPSYTAPADLDLSHVLRNVPHSLYLGTYFDETAADCEWFVPMAHPLESWGDARAADGTVSIVQPLIAPLHGGVTAAELLSVFARQRRDGGDLLVREILGQRLGLPNGAWEETLRRGFVPGTEFTPVNAPANWGVLPELLTGLPAKVEGFEIDFAPDDRVLDGRFANNGWLQELPDPTTKLTWGNAALLSPATASRLKVEDGQRLTVTAGSRALDVRALVMPGHADDAATLRFGYGRLSRGEILSQGVGADAFDLWTTASPAFAAATLDVHGDRVDLPVTQRHFRLAGRAIALEKDLAAFQQDDHPVVHEEPLPSLYEPFKHEGVQWGMGIDLSLCTGCSACVVACQAENNIPIVGPSGVNYGREMHWLRIDRYFAGEVENPRVLTQPMLCQHCEKAPCEYVCPVNATTHSPDGINEMTYNRCVGTRFCANNCPYKVRRFNWFDYNGRKPPLLRMAMNPEVTVRARGVMEKCTFCVQRIRRAEITAEIARRPLREGDVVTACQQACPTGAIVFGDINDPASEVARRYRDRRAYMVLYELGTRPRVRYLARLRNPNPELS